MSPESNADIDRIYLDIALAGFPENARAFTEKILEFCEDLSTFPRRGTARPKIAPGLRTVGFRRQVTVVFHIVEEERLVIIDRILHKGRSLQRVFEEHP